VYLVGLSTKTGNMGVFWIFFAVIVVGYLLQSYALLAIFYLRLDRVWKTQPSLDSTVGRLWLPPLLSSKPNRAPGHRFICTFNLLMAGMFAGLVAELISSGRSRLLTFDSTPSLLGWLRIVAVELTVCVAYESVVEYWWHRLMHIPFFYRRLHKLHHHYKSPEVYDDMMIHPLEAFGYYCILYSPPFVFPVTLQAFVLYMITMGIFGVWDHSGIRLRCSVFGLKYDSADHDLHHELTTVNYGFPFMLLDQLHGTYVKPPERSGKQSS